jgi:acid phosphatase
MAKTKLWILGVSAAIGCGAPPAVERVADAPATAASVPRSRHVWLVTEENFSYERVIGSAAMPYFNGLAHQYGLATEYYSNQHSSLPALMWLVAGAPVEPNNTTTSCQHSQDNIVRELLKNGYDWRSYQMNMPSPGYQGLFGGPNNTYYRRHNPLIDFTDVCPGTGQEDKSVPYTQVAADFARGFTVNYAYITPDAAEDLHSGPAQAADNWLAGHLPAILARREFGPAGDGILFITFDEGDLGSDNRCSSSVSSGCGGHIATLVIGPKVTPGFRSTATYHHENLLKTVCVAMGLPTCPGAAQNAAPMADFFGGAGATSGVTISSPGNGATVFGPVHVVANAVEDVPISQMQVWDNGTKLGVFAGAAVNDDFMLSPGSHATTVLDLDDAFNVIHKTTVSFTIAAPASCSAPAITDPTAGESVGPAIDVQVNAPACLIALKAYIDGNPTPVASASTNRFPSPTWVSVSPGMHVLQVNGWDAGGKVYTSAPIEFTRP